MNDPAAKGDQFAHVAESLRTFAAMKLQAATTVVPKDGSAPIRDALVRRSLSRVGSLANSAAALASPAHEPAISILNRAVVEEFIRLHWALMSEENAQFLEDAGVDEFRRMARANLEAGVLRFVDTRTNEDATHHFIRANKLATTTKKKSLEQMAREADVLHIYSIFYRFGSLSTHGNESGADEDGARALEVLQAFVVFSRLVGHLGVRWLLGRSRPDNETIRSMLGLDSTNDAAPNQP